MEGPRQLRVNVERCGGGIDAFIPTAEALQKLVSSTMRGLQQQARVRLAPSEDASAAEPLHVSEVASLLGHCAPLPEIQVRLWDVAVGCACGI